MICCMTDGHGAEEVQLHEAALRMPREPDARMPATRLVRKLRADRDRAAVVVSVMEVATNGIAIMVPWILTPIEARGLAADLLAAAETAEGAIR